MNAVLYRQELCERVAATQFVVCHTVCAENIKRTLGEHTCAHTSLRNFVNARIKTFAACTRSRERTNTSHTTNTATCVSVSPANIDFFDGAGGMRQCGNEASK
jgi:hypothetical protein